MQIKNNNFPICFVAMPILSESEQKDKPKGYICSPAFLVREIKEYLCSGKADKSYDLVCYWKRTLDANDRIQYPDIANEKCINTENFKVYFLDISDCQKYVDSLNMKFLGQKLDGSSYITARKQYDEITKTPSADKEERTKK